VCGVSRSRLRMRPERNGCAAQSQGSPAHAEMMRLSSAIENYPAIKEAVRRRLAGRRGLGVARAAYLPRVETLSVWRKTRHHQKSG